MPRRAPISRTLLALLAALGVVLALAGPIAVRRQPTTRLPHQGHPDGVADERARLRCRLGRGCALTDMARVGTTSVFELDATVPAGSYEFKVRLNGSWDENYGAGGVRADPTSRSCCGTRRI